MTTLHEQRAAKMYGSRAPAKAAPRPAAPATKSLYQGKSPDNATEGSLDVPLCSYYDRRESTLRGDSQRLAETRQERKQLEAFVRSRGISSEHLHEALTAMHDHDVLPRSAEAVEKRRVRTLESLRLVHGGADQAQAHINNYVAVTAELAKEVPTLAARANATGAGEDPRIINALAHYGEIKPTTEK